MWEAGRVRVWERSDCTGDDQMLLVSPRTDDEGPWGAAQTGDERQKNVTLSLFLVV